MSNEFYTDKAWCLYPNHIFHGDGYVCRCHELLGNDYWFLPEDRCLYDDGEKSENKTVSPETVE